MALLSVRNVNKRSPISFVRIKRVFNIALVPVVVTTLKGLWDGSDAQLNKILIIITISLPGLLEVIGMLLADEPMTVNSDDVSVQNPQ